MDEVGVTCRSGWAFQGRCCWLCALFVLVEAKDVSGYPERLLGYYVFGESNTSTEFF